MADIILSPLLQVIFDRLASPILQSLGDIYDLKDNFQDLQKVLLMAQDVLEDAEEDQEATSNRAFNTWLLKLKEAAYNAEDVLDQVAARFKVYEAQETDRIHRFLRETELVKDADEVRKMLEELKKTAMEGSGFHIRKRELRTAASERREYGSYVVESEVHGREGDKEQVIDLLLRGEEGEEDGEIVSFLPIVGLGGLGKTTLAQLAYNDERVIQHFDLRIWVFISDDFDAKRVVKALVESASMERCDALSMEAIQNKLLALLHRRRFLIVLDDVWNEDEDEWWKLESLLQCRSMKGGSRVIITTRSQRVASMMSSPTFPYKLEGLAEKDCWMLFKRWAFPCREEDTYPNLLSVGKGIIKKCRGMPSVAKVLGSLMRFRREERDWCLVQNNELFSLDVYRTNILPSLRFSYLHLKSNLKRCFAFCSMFPRGYVIKKEKLIRMWIAAGLIQSYGGSKPPEQIGIEYFEDLQQMFFLQDAAEIGSNGINGYMMHEIIHDLARSVAGKESDILETGLYSVSLSQTRHSTVIYDPRSAKFPQDGAKHLRSLRLAAGDDIQECPSKVFTSFPFLRVLDLNACGLYRLAHSIENLLCLRYLDLSNTPVRFLPYGTIEQLPLLQTLDLSGCCNLKELPAISKMPSLRHLNITGCQALTTMSPFFPAMHQKYGLSLDAAGKRQKFINSTFLPGPSNQLQTLPTIMIGGFLDLMFLGRLNLRGELNIRHLKSVHIIEDAYNANLIKKDNLESLGLFWDDQEDNFSSDLIEQDQETTLGERHHSAGPPQGNNPDAIIAEEVIKGLEPHRNLKILLVDGYPGTRFPQWRLPNLTEVTLTNCRNCEHVPTLGNLLLLKKISLQGMHAVKCIGKEFYGLGTSRPFPLLKELVLADFPELEKWYRADGSDAFPCLTKLIIERCPKMIAMPFCPSLKHLELRHCDSVLFESIGSLIYLGTLVIEGVENFSSFPRGFLANSSLLSSLEIISCPSLHLSLSELESLTALKWIKLRQCEELSNLLPSLQNLEALDSLEISDCNSIISIPEEGIGGLISLKTFSIKNCINLSCLSMRMQHLTHLEHLVFMNCPNLVSFRKDMHYLSSLQSFCIFSCPLILSLPEELQHLETLHSLEIRSCPGLTELPEWIGSITSLQSLTISNCCGLKQLPESVEFLTALQQISIEGCPELEEKCREDVGEDWPKIAHVPLKYVGSFNALQATAGSLSVSKIPS